MPPGSVLHAHWGGDTIQWGGGGAEPRRTAWRETAALQTSNQVGAWNLQHYRIKHRLSLGEMCALLDDCIEPAELRRVELEQAPIPDDLAAWLAR